MDRGTKIYAFILALITIVIAIVFLYESPKVRQLNDRLSAIEEIKQFPYPFKIVRVKNTTAVISTPRSTEVPVSKILGILFPRVKGESTQSTEFRQAQQALARVQKLTRDTVLADKDIKQVSWELDREWLTQQGVLLTALP